VAIVSVETITYRCAARSIVPGSPILDTHPKSVYLPEAAVLEAINGWMGSVFDPNRRDETVQRMLGAAAGQPDDAQAAAAQRALAGSRDHDVESLGVAGAGAAVSFELARRRHR
jgi:hypothetical protein